MKEELVVGLRLSKVPRFGCTLQVLLSGGSECVGKRALGSMVTACAARTALPEGRKVDRPS